MLPESSNPGRATVAQSLHNQIVDSYYQTTAARSHSASREYYEVASNGLKRWIARWLPQDRQARCLDLASGCGELMYFLEREGYRNTAGVDLCAEELDQARLLIKGELFKANIIDHLRALDAGSVDLITAMNILEHLTKDDLLTVLREARRVLRSGGTLIALVPNALSPFGSSTRYWDMTHEWAFTPGNFRQLCDLTGFDERIDFLECAPVPHGVVSFFRYLLWQVMRAAVAGWMLVEVGTTRDRVYTMNMLVRLHAPSS